MGRIPRTFLLYGGCYAHVISRSIAKQKIFEDDGDFLFFEKLLLMAREEFFFDIPLLFDAHTFSFNCIDGNCRCPFRWHEASEVGLHASL